MVIIILWGSETRTLVGKSHSFVHTVGGASSMIDMSFTAAWIRCSSKLYVVPAWETEWDQI